MSKIIEHFNINEIKIVHKIEILVLKCNKRINKILTKNLYFALILNKKNKFLKIANFLDFLCLNLLRKNLYRILDKSITEPSFRKLIKIEIFKVPTGTFSEFIILFNELKSEMEENSNM